MMKLAFAASFLVTLAFGQAEVWAEDQQSQAQVNFFEEKIRPVLAAKCYKFLGWPL